jgi:hypothetical protein
MRAVMSIDFERSERSSTVASAGVSWVSRPDEGEMRELSRARKSSSADASCNCVVRANIPYPSDILQNDPEPIMACSPDLPISLVTTVTGLSTYPLVVTIILAKLVAL